MKTKLSFEDIIDNYFEYPVVSNYISIIVILVLESVIITPVLSKNTTLLLFNIITKNEQAGYISSIIGASIALSGFIIAALTIMVTVKSSLRARGIDDAENAMEYLFTTKHYRKIISVFKKSIIELLLGAFILYITWLSLANISALAVQRIVLGVTISMALSVIRSVYVLFKVLDLEKLESEK